MLYTQGAWGVVVDSEVGLIVASGASGLLTSSRRWSGQDAQPTPETDEIAEAGLSGLVASGKGSSSKYTIPKSVQAEAKKGLEWRKEEGRGGTNVGLNTARTLAKGGQIGIEKVRHIARYFPRHEVDKKAEGYKPGETNFPSNGRIAWALWGGDAGWRWARTIVEREEKKALNASGYELKTFSDKAVDADEFTYNDSPDFMSEFLARVRLDGSGMDRLYRVDSENNCFVWDDGQWDDLGIIDGNIWDYDKELDGDVEDSVEKTHFVVDPESAIIIAARLFVSPQTPVTVEDIDEYEAKLAVAAIEDEDWDFIDNALLSGGSFQAEEEDDDGYTPEERAEKAATQVRDKQGRFAKTGSKVVVGNDPARGSGVITGIEPETKSVVVQLDSGREITVPANTVEDAKNYPDVSPESAEAPSTERKTVDTSGILSEKSSPVQRTKAELPDVLPTVEPKELRNILSNWPAWVKEQREKQESDTEKATTRSDTYSHPLLQNWMRKKSGAGKYPMSSWSNPITASADEKLISPNTSDVQPVYMAVVDADDPRAVLDLISIVPASTVSNSPMVYTRDKGKWVRDPKTLADLNSPTPPPVVPLDSEETLNDVLKQVDSSQGVTASIALTVLYGNQPVLSSAKENISRVLRRYWISGPGSKKIQWGVGGDWYRCVRQLVPFLGVRSKGYCQMLHKAALGYYTSTHARMERAKAGLFEAETEDQQEFEFTEVTEQDMHTPLSQIVSQQEEDEDFDIDEDIKHILSDIEGLDYAEYSLVAAGGADRNRGGAENLRRYWTIGKGGLKIRWGTPGDWTRCVRQLRKYMGPRAKGYCSLRHKEMTGMWPGDRKNRGKGKKKFSVDDNFFVKSEEQIITDAFFTAFVSEELEDLLFSDEGYSPEENLEDGDQSFIESLTATAGAKPAPKKEQIKGSERNKPGSAKTGAGVSFTKKIEDALEAKVSKHNETAKQGRKTNIRTLKAVYRRGAGAFSTSHRPDQNRNSWAMARVNAFLHLLKTGTPKNKKYITDNDLLPASHPKSTKNSSSALTSAGYVGGGGSRFIIPLVIPEDMESGDGRKFKKGAIELRELPLPLLWQIQTGAGHDGSVVVGRIEHMERTEEGIGNAYGVFDNGAYGREAERLVRNGFIRGVSADMDKFEATEEVVTEASDDEDKKIKKEKIIINKARVMAVTIVPKPAFQECQIFLDEPEDETQEDNMIPDGIYIEDIEPSEAEAVVASGLIAGSIPVAPPKSWFQNPQLKQPTPLTVTDEGRVYGHIAAWDVDHIGMVSGTRPPRSKSNYSYFHTGLLRTEEGADVAVGQITLAGGHADIRASASEAVKHYDDTASAVIDVHAGEDAYGIWVAGSLRPGVSPEQVRALRASAPSGDWRPIRGSLELVAVCQVNVPGFPIARAMVASGQVTALIAAGASVLAKMRHNPMQELDERLSKLEGQSKATLIAAAQEARAKFQALRPEPVSKVVTEVEEPVVADAFYQEVEPRLVELLEKTLADVVSFTFIAQGYHWNVKGKNFPQYHEFFGDIYEEVQDSIDPLAENILKLGYDAPMGIASYAQMSELSASGTKDSSCEAMSYDLYMANNKVLDMYKEAFSVADSMNEQGVADFLAGRIDAHQKWAWQLKASSMPEKMRKDGYEDSPEPMDMMMEYSDEIPEVAILSSGVDHSFEAFSAITELAKFTKEEREELAKEGKALPDGSYPIRNEEDLKNAIKTYGLGKSPKKEIRAHIIKMAKELNKEDMIPENWSAKSFSIEDMRNRIAELSANLEK
jgi:DNA-binding ferritin-like protein